MSRGERTTLNTTQKRHTPQALGYVSGERRSRLNRLGHKKGSPIKNTLNSKVERALKERMAVSSADTLAVTGMTRHWERYLGRLLIFYTCGYYYKQ